MQLANDYPYMWALYAVAIALPFVLCACCCVRSKPAKPKDEAAERKKTDAPSPDDPKAKKEDDNEQSKSEEKKKEGEEPKLESPVEEQAEVSFTDTTIDRMVPSSQIIDMSG